MDTIPKPDLLHPVLVDRKSNQVAGPPQPGMRVARESLPIHYVDIQPASAFGKFFQTTLAPAWNAYSRQMRRKVEKAQLAISQTDIGCDLLSWAYRSKTEIGLEGGLIGSGGYHSPIFGIRTNTRLKGYDLEFNLLHELEHNRHMAGALKTNIYDAIATQIQKSRICESAARAAVGVHAFQRFYGRPDDAANVLRGEGAITALKSFDKRIWKAAMEHRDLAIRCEWDSFAGKLFEAAKKDFSNHADYDFYIINSASNKLNRLRHDFSVLGRAPDAEKAMSRSAPSTESMATELRMVGQPYINPAMLADEDMTELSFTLGARKALKEFQQQAIDLNKEYGLNINCAMSGSSFLGGAVSAMSRLARRLGIDLNKTEILPDANSVSNAPAKPAMQSTHYNRPAGAVTR